jgi:DNA-nicking Smr family endonuclease
MKKRPRPSQEESAKPAQPDPKFRPLEAQLKKLAEAKKQEDAAKQAAAQAVRTKAVEAARKPKHAPPPKAEPVASRRSSTLTLDEHRDLATMQKTEDDEWFFRRLMSGVVPMGADTRGRVTTAGKVEKPAAATRPTGPDPDEEVRTHLMQLVEGGARFEVSDDGRRLEGRRLDLDPSTWRRVRRGELPVDARLDLHGKRSDEAREALEVFLRDKRARRDRTVLVIHGRGEHSPGGAGVLRGEIAAWLSQGRASQHVAAFATAHGDDGGEGALYVLLRT